MKTRNFLMAVLIIINFSFKINNCISQWTQCNGVYSGYVRAFATSGNRIFAGESSHGVYYSGNSGETWTQTALNNESVTSIIVNGNNIFAGIYSRGVFLSTNNGTTWIKTSLNSSKVNALATDGVNIYAGVGLNFGVYISTNNGANWTQTSLNNRNVLSLATSGSNILAGTTNGTFLSSNNGLNWIQITLPNSNGWVFSFASNSNYIFAGLRGGIYLSTNNGLNWSKSNCPVDNNEFISSLFSDGPNIYACSDNDGSQIGRIFKSTDNGTTWVILNWINARLKSITISNSNIIAGTFNFGIYLSSNNGANWIQTGLNTGNVNSFTSFGSYLFAGSKGIYRSSNDGLNWYQLNDYKNFDIFCMAANSIFIFAGTALDPLFGERSFLIRSSNSGVNWIGGAQGGENEFLSIAVESSNIFASAGLIMRSSNNGANWMLIFGVSSVSSLATNYLTVYAGTDSGVFISTNSGDNWTKTSLNYRIVKSLAISGNRIFAGTVNFGVYVSVDNGVNWTHTTLNNRTVRSLTINGTNIFAGTDSNGIYLSTDNGNSWLQKNEGFTSVPTVRALMITNGYLFAGTEGQSVWRRPLSELITGIQTVNIKVPERYFLYQNYPNPFNSMTNVKFQVPMDSRIHGNDNVVLKVFDLLGKEVATLINEKLQQGMYEVTFDAGDLPSGVYFYKFMAGKFTDTKRMILIK